MKREVVTIHDLSDAERIELLHALLDYLGLYVEAVKVDGVIHREIEVQKNYG